MLFFKGLSIISIILSIVCCFFPFTSFGTIFFALLAICCIFMCILIKVSKTGGKYAQIAHTLSKLGIIIFILWSISFIIVEGFITTNSNEFLPDTSVDYLFVLGGGIIGDSPSLTLKNRLDTAKDYIDNHPATIAVLCGGQGEDEIMPEADVMSKYLIQNGIDEDNLIIENASRNTIQNISHGKSIIDAIDQDYTTAVVTSEFHLFRAKRLMHNAGLDCYGLPANTPYLALKMLYSIREYFSIMGLILTGRF